MILLIDNYDSFVFNIKQYLHELSDDEILCVRNDEISINEIKRLKPNKIILSPGPKHPKDSGICLEILKSDLDMPILGICLGHQAIGLCFNASIKQLAIPQHGKTSRIKVLSSDDIFKGLPSEFEVMRYHSLYVDELNDDLEPLAYSDDGIIMALRVKNRNIYGIQFHPESYFSEYGKKILSNFLEIQTTQLQKEPESLDFKEYLIKLQDDKQLDDRDFKQICKIIASQEYEIAQLAALLVLISEKSLYPKSLASLAQNILYYSNTFRDDSDMIDVCGTGGDGFKSINVSTAVAFIVASFGIKVAKHGNKAVSSSSGSSDVLSSLKIELNGDLINQKEILKDKNLAFFHAPFFHPLVGQVRETRARLGIRTVFNILGPMLHPNLSLKYQLVGVYHKPVLNLYAQALKILGRKHALVVRGNDGMDEISICDETRVVELKDQSISEYTITPEQFGFKRAFKDEIKGGTPEQNAQTLIKILKGEEKGAKRDIVVLNAMFALYTADFVKNPMDAKELILNNIENGKIYEFFKDYTA